MTILNLQVIEQPVEKIEILDEIVKIGEPVIIEKEFTENGTYRASSDDVDGYSPVTVNVDTETPYNNGYNDGYEQGYADAPPDNLHGTTIAKFPNLNVFNRNDVVFNLPLITNFKQAFYQDVKNTTVEHLTLNGSQNGTITTMESCFVAKKANGGDTKLKRLTVNCDFSNCKSFYSMCANLYSLEVIDGVPIDFSGATSVSNMFSACSNLKEFRVEPQTIKISFSTLGLMYITDETIQSIVDGLADLTGQTQQTVSFDYFPALKVTETQKATMTAKNWSVVLMD